VGQIKKDFVTTINNPQKIHPPAYLSVEEVQVQDQTILHVYVPESSQVHRCNGRIYDRNEDGDLDITDHTRLVSELYTRKQATYSENKVYPYAGLEDLRPDLIDKCRRLAGVWRDGHPWLDMDDMELIKSAQLYQTDPETGKNGLNLAGIPSWAMTRSSFLLSPITVPILSSERSTWTAMTTGTWSGPIS
jgi:ATP-dependent DNA helicase RecG